MASSWTTDAPYRETAEEITAYRGDSETQNTEAAATPACRATVNKAAASMSMVRIPSSRSTSAQGTPLTRRSRSPCG